MAVNHDLTMMEMWGEGFSTFWRRGSHTELSSVIFNMIHALPPDDPVWPAFNTFIFDRIGHITCATITAKQIASAVRAWNVDDVDKLKLTAQHRHLALAYSCALRLIDDREFDNLQDWFRICAGTP